MRRVLIGICSCFAHFYAPKDWDRFEEHVTDDNASVHQWVEVPDIKIVSQEIVDAPKVQRKGKARSKSVAY